MGGGGSTISTEAPRIGAMRIQTSAYGVPITLLWGQTRVQGNLLWFGDFIATPHTTTQSSGGKGGGGGVTYNNTTYTYTGAVAIGLCEGVIDTISGVWAGKTQTTLGALGFTTFTGAAQQSPWSYLTSLHAGQDLGYENTCYVANGSYALMQDGTLPNHSFEIRRQPFGSIGGKTFSASMPGLKNVSSVASSNFFIHRISLASAAHGFTDEQAVGFPSTAPPGFAINTTYYIYPVDANNFALRAYPGGPPISRSGSGITAGSWLIRLVQAVIDSTAHGFAQGQIVRLTTTVALPAGLALNTDYYINVINANQYYYSATSGGAAISLFTAGTGTHTATPIIIDANPKDVLNDFLTNVDYGVLFPSSKIGDLTQYSNYCVARGLFISPALTAQAPAHQFVDDILDLTNSSAVWSGGVLKIVPYGDQAVTGNGATYTPNVTPIYDLTDDDFIAPAGADPVTQPRSPPSDAFNQIQVKFTNRSTQYNDDVADAKDQANIELYGLRAAQPATLKYINDLNVARAVAQTLLQRGLYVRNTYKFSVGMRFALLEPMDIVTITDAGLFLNKAPVRITQIEESDNGFTIEAEEFAAGVGHAALYNTQSGVGYSTNYNVSPGSINAPFIFDAPGILTVTGYEIWAAVSGGANWGGCEVWTSVDGAEYKKVGIIQGGARYGVLTSNLALNTTNPDLTGTLTVDLSPSFGALTGGTQADADAFNTLSLIDQEILSFRDAALTGTYQYNLSGYLRRGVYQSVSSLHAIGSNFVRVDQAIFKEAYDPTLAGSVLYFKFPSFNIYGNALESIASLNAYQYTIGGALGAPKPVTNFGVSQNKGVLVFTWDINVEATDGYEIRYGQSGASNWDSSVPLTKVTRGTSITSAKVPPNNAYRFFIRARDKSGRYSLTDAIVDYSVITDYITFFDFFAGAFSAYPIPIGVLFTAPGAYGNDFIFQQRFVIKEFVTDRDFSGTLVAGASQSVTLNIGGGASAVTDYYKAMTVILPDGRVNRITAYDGGSGVATLYKRWATNQALWSDDLTQTSAWTAQLGATVRNVASQTHEGLPGNVSEITFPQITTGERIEQSTAIAAVNGDSWNAVFWVRGTGTINLNIGTSTGVGGATEPTVTLSPTAWQRFAVNVTFVSPSGNVRVTPIWRPGNTASKVQVSRVTLEKVTVDSLAIQEVKTKATAIALPDNTTTVKIVNRTMRTRMDLTLDWNYHYAPLQNVGITHDINEYYQYICLDSDVLARELTNVQLFESFLPSPTPTGWFETPEIDTGFDSNIPYRTYSNASLTVKPPTNPALPDSFAGLTFSPEFSIKSRYSFQSYVDWQPWTIGDVLARYIKHRVDFTATKGKAPLQYMDCVCDMLPREEILTGVSVAATSGTLISFIDRFHTAPTVFFYADESTPKTATATFISPTGFFGHLFSSAGVDVGGTGKYRAFGV